MNDQFEKFKKEAERALKEAADLNGLEHLRVEFLGRKGKLAGLMKELSRLTENERKIVGQIANEVKEGIESAFAEREHALSVTELAGTTTKEWIDVTEPGLWSQEGHLHPVSTAIAEITRLFERIGFTRVRAPEIDWDWYAFESLNMPPEHPARDDWETFFIADTKAQAGSGKLGKVVLTPHTSNSQVREMEKGTFPIRMININRTYRRQSDVSHVPMFHQFEGLLVGEGITIAHLKGVLDYFAQNYFGAKRRIRLRPHHFRFTEPSFEVDVSCDVCGGNGMISTSQKLRMQGAGKPATEAYLDRRPTEPAGSRNAAAGGISDVVCRLCKSGWLELGGAGMVHPNVLKAGKLDPKKYTGFAFGWGVERTLMMREGMKLDDIRVLYRNDLRFVEQF